MHLKVLYQKLLQAYPKSYQHDYAQEMTYMLTDMLADEPSRLGRAKIWATAFIELPFHIAKYNYVVVEEAYTSDTPNYIKRNARLSLLLVLPFIALIIVNELRTSALPSTPSWTDIYQFLAIGLPFLAFLLCVGTLLRWFISRRSNHTSVKSSLADIKHNWPIVAAGCFTLLITMSMAGHDSAHCINGNPVKELRNFSTTLRCIQED